MKKIIILTCLLAQIVHAQETNFISDTIYLDINRDTTRILEDAVYARITKKQGLKQLVGITKDYYYPSWKKQFEGKLLSQFPDVFDGLCTFYYENGNVRSRIKYTNKKSTILELWDENGHKVNCNDSVIESAPLTELKLGSSLLSSNSSRMIYTVNIGYIYKKLFISYQIYDEGINPEFMLASNLVSAYYSGGISLLKNLLSVKETKDNRILTKNTIFFTYDRSVAAAFLAKKPYDETKLFNKQQNISSKTFEFDSPTKIMYICIQNDNLKTNAIARIHGMGTINNCGN